MAEIVGNLNIEHVFVLWGSTVSFCSTFLFKKQMKKIDSPNKLSHTNM